MATPDDQWWDAQAGEYVLGTLRGAERDVFEKILAVDSQARSRVLYWEIVFSSLDKNIKEIEPPEYILPRILTRIQSNNQTPTTTSTTQQSNASNQSNNSLDTQVQSDAPSRIDSTRRRRSSRVSKRIWKGIAGLATAASIGLAALLVSNVSAPIQPNSTSIDSVTVIQNENQQALWVINVVSGSNTVQTIAIDPPEITDDQSHQLWIVKPDNAGVSSVGLLPRIAGASTSLNYTTTANEAAVFAVSLEPKGGSPKAVPTGPVLFSGSAVFVGGSN